MNSKDLRIVYMGTPDFAVTPLRNLVESGYNIVGVVTTPDRASGRGLKTQECAVKRYASEVGLKVLQPEKLKNEQFIADFKALDPDLGIVIAFRMLPEVIWAMPRLGTFNLHASLLPQYRGAAPINWAIINGETQSGVTTFMLNHEIDKGDILCQTATTIEPADNVGILHDKLMNLGSQLVALTVEKIANSDIDPIEQQGIDPDTLKSAPKIFKDSCKIDWNMECTDIHNLIRGLSPYPAAWSPMYELGSDEMASEVTGSNSGEIRCPKTTEVASGKINEASDCKTSQVPAAATDMSLKIFASDTVKSVHNLKPGTIQSDAKSYIRVACADGFIDILELQLSGRKRMSSIELLRGFKTMCGYKLMASAQ